MEDIKNTSTEGTQTGTEDTHERTFTQDDVNRIVQERLAKEKGKGTEEFDKRSAELDKREFNIKARETLSSKGFPAELLGALNCENEETFNKSLETIEKLFGGVAKQQERDKELEAKRSRIIGRSISSSGMKTGADKDAEIRERMGLHSR